MSATDEIDQLAERFYSFFDNRDGRYPDVALVPQIFLSKARIFYLSQNRVQAWSLDAFLKPRITWLSDGTLLDFHEWEIGARTTVFGGMANRFSEYQKCGRRDNIPFEGCGKKLIQLCLLAEGWRISSLLWEEG